MVLVSLSTYSLPRQSLKKDGIILSRQFEYTYYILSTLKKKLCLCPPSDLEWLWNNLENIIDKQMIYVQYNFFCNLVSCMFICDLSHQNVWRTVLSSCLPHWSDTPEVLPRAFTTAGMYPTERPIHLMARIKRSQYPPQGHTQWPKNLLRGPTS